MGLMCIPFSSPLAKRWHFSMICCPLEPFQLDGQPYQASQLSADLDFADVRGQEAVKRAHHASLRRARITSS